MVLYNGDAIDVLKQLPSESVHCCVTSPPFFNLRDYGVAGQIGLEDTPEEWVQALVRVFHEVRRVLRHDGTFWVEVGDSYNAARSGGHPGSKTGYNQKRIQSGTYPDRSGANVPGLKAKDLIGAPWMLAFALRNDGWYLRAENIWDKPDAMPESIQDRTTRSHSHVFMLSKKEQYFYDKDAIATPHKHDGRNITKVVASTGSGQHRDGERWPGVGANARSVWRIPTESTSFRHFAPMTQEVARRCILAGTSAHGCCATCGAPWARELGEAELAGEQRLHSSRPAADVRGVSATGLARSNGRTWREREFLGWKPTCGCEAPLTAPVVLDPFAGSGTTMLVARSLERRSIGIELNPEYCEMTVKRLRGWGELKDEVREENESGTDSQISLFTERRT